MRQPRAGLLALLVFPLAALAAPITPRLGALLDPAPVAAWAPALQGLSAWALQGRGLEAFDGDPSWGRMGAFLTPEAAPEAQAALAPMAAALEALAQESPQLRWQVMNIQALTRKEQKRLVKALEDAREKAKEELKEALKEFNVQAAADGEAGDIAELEAFRHRLDALSHLGLYGSPKSLAAARDKVREHVRDLRTGWVTLSLERDAERLGTPLEQFLLEFHRDLILTRPDLYRLKLEKAAESDFDFFRAFPQLHYRFLRDLPEAAQLRQSPELDAVDGDAHPENVLLVEKGRLIVPQFNDFDDSDRGHSALDLARMLTGAALLGDGTTASVERLVQAGLKAYREALALSFEAWSQVVSREKAVASAKPRNRDWVNHAGVPVGKEDRIAALRGAMELSDNWQIHDRRGAGESSIGVLRYMAVKAGRRHSYELKQLRGPAVAYFSGEAAGTATHRERLDRAYRVWRRDAPEEGTHALAFEESDWLLRRREGYETSLSFKDPESVARVMGGLVAQGHRGQEADLRALLDAAEAFPLRVVPLWIQEVARLRQELVRLLEREPN